ncbi:MAG: hypothetical protein COV55_04735 [Candidatus Komeilibacteria bacterium CG11_big_fil_rev_8_21_14_0_20_36_20]|uniref:Solute-binding protein family 5 domain-containing protein n=2 Tax=Patescibacteria group TaxID=1783273 RepID=A0A2H0NBB0_9BACT|nr:MAG: hypothetical protein COV55_04735 [Candidatus Komeilibacteria bacterium CG11_big_fil_rev_8_21_14_0_20_36_20]PIR81860.1 MAG: hypothetical protein COU21_01645 [Candidatus Komeilibacteria bacterium CG10_big_fil_rev_8_21_14_0_10_36_65]PIZ66259.1 MAG: hypothetical protein COY14_00635 [Candidatus Roizmanbacteria bacterium CG_4_10_14_0_2_um_filter_36_9]PJC55068.1 MAG: hypothetical protein CO027_04000 [Candidatus Komeilibacteria bacterium CG_4_9_14_0_2_um_filter_36_13]
MYKKIKGKFTTNEVQDVNQQLVLQLNKKNIPSWEQIKQWPKFLHKSEKLQIIIALTVFVAAGTTFGWHLYLKNSVLVPANGGSYTEGLIGSPHLINPILAATDIDRDLVKLIFSGLMRTDASGELVPDLAAAYQIDEAQTVYTFELRPNLKWHDDNPITADDIIFTINSIKNSEYKSPLKNSFNGITVRKINDRTIQFELEKPFPPFLSILTIGIIPEHLWYSIPAFGAPLADLNTKPIGSGPYQFKSLTKDANGSIKSYTLKTYENYHLEKTHISKLSFKFYPDFLTGVTALQNKNIEGLVYLPTEYKQEFNNKINLINLHYPKYTAIFFNPKENELLSDKDFRKALAISVDKQRILTEVLNDDGQIIYSPILPGLIGYEPAMTGDDYSPEEAKKILEELDWTLPAKGPFRTKGEGDEKQELSIKLTTIDQSENVKTISIIKENWESIGIKTELDIVSKDKIKTSIIEPRNYQALVFSEVININSSPYPFWHSSQNQHPGLNLSVLANKDIDDYLEIIQNAKDDLSKIEPLKKFQEKLLELNFAIFLYNPTYTYPVANKIKGLESLQFINLPADRFNNITSWFIKTKRVLSK